MSATTKFPDILGNDWECKREPPLGKIECPNYDGIGPELLHATGEWMCRKCFKVIGQENSTDDEIQDDDAIDDENKEEMKQPDLNTEYNVSVEQNSSNQPEIDSQLKADQNSSEANLGEGSLFAKNETIEFLEESLEKEEAETQLFTNDHEVNHAQTQDESSFENKDIKAETFSDLDSENKDDLEIPAFLRRQTN